jgi:hypothetical protein
MGKPLSEREKARRAAARMKNQFKEALPLFADFAPQVDERALLYARRAGHARAVEHLAGLAADRLLDALFVSQLKERHVRPHVPPDWWRPLCDWADRVFPPPDERQVGLWLDVLRGARKDLVLAEGHGPTRGGFRLVVVELAWPPAGWAPPYSKEELAALFWRRCPACRMWHAPLQQDCFTKAPAEGPATLPFTLRRPT